MSKMSKAIAVLGVVAGLGVAALPLSSYAAFDTAQVTAKVNGAISVTVTGNKDTATGMGDGYTVGDKEVFLNPINGGTAAEGKASVKVSGNAPAGYTLTIKDSDAQTALVSAENQVIAAGVPAQGSSLWGFKGGSVGSYQGIQTTDTEIAKTTEALATEGATTEVTFGVSVSADQAEGLYKGGVIFTAVANN